MAKRKRIQQLVCPNCEGTFFRPHTKITRPRFCPHCQMKMDYALNIKKTKPQVSWIKERRMLNQHVQYAGSTLEGKLAGRLGGFGKKHWPLISLIIAAPAIANELKLALEAVQLRRAQQNYLISPATILRAKRIKLRRRLHRKVRRGTWIPKAVKSAATFPKRYPKTTVGLAGIGLGAQLSQRKQQPRQYGFATRHPYTPHTVPGPSAKKLLGGVARRAGKLGVKAGRLAATGAAAGLTAWIIGNVLNELQRHGKPYIPDIRPDIELAPQYQYQQQMYEHVANYAGMIPNRPLRQLQRRLGLAAKKTRDSVTKGMLIWLMGFISAEIIGRGITVPKKRLEHDVSFAAVSRKEAVGKIADQWTKAERRSRRIHTLAKGHRQEVKVLKRLTKGYVSAQFPKTIPRGRLLKTTGGVLPLAALAMLIQRRRAKAQETRQPYFAAAALPAAKIAAGVAKKGIWAASKKWGGRAFNTWIAADIASSLIPRKQKLTQPALGTSQGYNIEHVSKHRLEMPRFSVKWLRELADHIAKGGMKGNVARVEHIRELRDLAKRVVKERAVLATAGIGAGVGGYVAGKQLERKRIRKLVD